MDVQIGDIVFSGKRAWNFYSSTVERITGSKWSHCFIVMTDVAGQRAALEADIKVQIVPWHSEYEIKNDDYYEVYRPIKASDEEKAKSANLTYTTYAGQIYGFLQIPWFIWDAICKKIGLNSGRNWFPNGAICSEVQDFYNLNLNDEYAKAFSAYQDVNRVSPQELYEIVIARKDLYQFVGKRD